MIITPTSDLLVRKYCDSKKGIKGMNGPRGNNMIKEQEIETLNLPPPYSFLFHFQQI